MSDDPVSRERLRDAIHDGSAERRARAHTLGTLAQLEDAPPKAKASARDWPAPYRSRWEARYAVHLEWQQRAGIVLEWLYEPDTLVAAGGTKYRPDFRVTFADGRIEYHEVKGYMRPKDAVRMRECVPVSPYPIVLVRWLCNQWRLTPYRANP